MIQSFYLWIKIQLHSPPKLPIFLNKKNNVNIFLNYLKNLQKLNNIFKFELPSSTSYIMLYDHGKFLNAEKRGLPITTNTKKYSMFYPQHN